METGAQNLIMTKRSKTAYRSAFMQVCDFLGLERISWSLRRLFVPVNKSDLVLEVGSGGNPYFRANVLLDAYMDTRERHFEKLVADRTTILGFVENLPFKDKSFDFVIASHVLEHSFDPEKFLSELQRVARAGYIEVPDAFMERLNPYLDHRLEITKIDKKLVIRKKNKSIIDPTLNELYENKAKSIVTKYLFPKHPYHFHVRLYWKDKIDYEILNPEDDCSWPHIEDYPESNNQFSFISIIKSKILVLARVFLSQNIRNRNLDIGNLLRCPNCFDDNLEEKNNTIDCENCGASYQIDNGIRILKSGLGGAL